MKKKQKNFCIAVFLLMLFVLWTIAVCFIDVKAIGPQESTVGFAEVNRFFHNLTGVNMCLYTVTDWLGLVPIGFVFGFALLGLAQWIKRKHFLKVDYSILVLGGFFLCIMVMYFFFEIFAVNYRPVLIEGCLEASYPSSTTLLVMCVMPTAAIQFNYRIKNCTLKRCVVFLVAVFTAFMVIGRLISGVHWLSDIIGGVLLSAGLVVMYCYVISLKVK